MGELSGSRGVPTFFSCRDTYRDGRLPAGRAGDSKLRHPVSDQLVDLPVPIPLDRPFNGV